MCVPGGGDHGRPAPTQAQYEWTSSRPDGHAPIGVMGEHTHEHAEFMFSYRFMQMSMAMANWVDQSMNHRTRPGGMFEAASSGLGAAEWHVPLYQSLNGPQLETDWVLTVGWQKSFAPLGHG